MARLKTDLPEGICWECKSNILHLDEMQVKNNESVIQFYTCKSCGHRGFKRYDLKMETFC